MSLKHPKQFFELNEAGFIVDEKHKIFGRVGQPGGEGTAWYQLAASPYDEPSVIGLKDRSTAFDLATAELIRRQSCSEAAHS